MVNNDLNIGRQIGNYRLIGLINSGSFCSVYQGRHIIFEDDPIVAIKLLHASLHSQQDRNEFIKEAQVLRKLQHPHILRILDAGFQDGLPFLVTEYAVGGSLRDLLRKVDGKPLPLDEAIRILTQVGQALQYAHEQKIVHRDLKPENILFNERGDILLADFGIAVILASTRTGMVGQGGTPPYMAPEQFEGLASPKSDQYALGCIAYELVTGHQLFNIPNRLPAAYGYHHARVQPKPPTDYQPNLPTHIEQAILIALAKNRSLRHRDVSTFCKRLLKSKEAWLEEGNTLYSLNRYQEALAAFEQAIRLDPNDVSAYHKKGDALHDLKQNEKALAAFEQAIRLDPNYAPVYYSKGNVLLHLERAGEALAAFEQAIRLNPNFAAAYSTKGAMLIYLQRYEEAVDIYEQLIHLVPNSAHSYKNKGEALFLLKRYEEAIAAFNQAIRLAPDFADAYYSKGITLQNMGRHKEATKALNKASKLGGPGHWLYRIVDS